jgi:hypothetical protein
MMSRVKISKTVEYPGFGDLVGDVGVDEALP